jgi:methanogenic corrinoid protein MtbC1
VRLIGRQVDDAARFLDLLGERNRIGAVRLTQSLLADGWSRSEVITDVLAVSQRRVGELWSAGDWTISQEHAATAIVDVVLSSLVSTGDGSRGRLVVACCEEEWHSLPARMFAELLRDLDWEVVFLGASTDADSLGQFLSVEQPVALLVSCSLPMNLIGAMRMIDAAHAAGYRVLAGGAAVATAERAAAIGADGWAASLPAANDLLGAWRHDDGRPRATGGAGRTAAAPLLAAQAELVDRAMVALRERLPVMSTFTDRQVNRTRADFRYIVGFAAAAVLVEDLGVFEEFLAWLDAILVRVGLPRVLGLSLETLASVAPELPALQRVLAHGRAYLE